MHQPMGAMPWQQQPTQPMPMGGGGMPMGGPMGGGVAGGGGIGGASAAAANGGGSAATPVRPFGQDDSDSDDSYKISSYNIGLLP